MHMHAYASKFIYVAPLAATARYVLEIVFYQVSKALAQGGEGGGGRKGGAYNLQLWIIYTNI